MMMTIPSDRMTLTEARELLGISKTKIIQLVRDGKLTTEPNALDKRSKLVRRVDVEALAATGKKAGRRKQIAAH